MVTRRLTCQNIKRIFRPIPLPLLHYSTFSYSLVSYFFAQSMCSKMTSSFYRERDRSIEIILDNFTSTAFTHIILIIFDDVAFKKTDFLDKYTKTNCTLNNLKGLFCSGFLLFVSCQKS